MRREVLVRMLLLILSALARNNALFELYGALFSSMPPPLHRAISPRFFCLASLNSGWMSAARPWQTPIMNHTTASSSNVQDSLCLPGESP